MSETDRASPEAAILLVGDDEPTAIALQDRLVGAGYDVRRAHSAAEALGTLKSARADVIVMSLMLPDTDGLILCSTLRAKFPAPVILLSARAGEVDRALAIQSGAVALLAVPVDLDDLMLRVKTLVTGSAASARSRESAA